MKPDIHPNYRPVVFQDLSSEFAFLTRSTIAAKETIKWEDGNEYPLIKVDISSHSHPFYTGKQKTLVEGGRVDKFRRRYEQKNAVARSGASLGAIERLKCSTGQANACPVFFCVCHSTIR